MQPKTTAAVILATLCLMAATAHAQAARGQGGEGASTQIATPTSQPSVAGDFNGDGDVDGRDFLIWRR